MLRRFVRSSRTLQVALLLATSLALPVAPSSAANATTAACGTSGTPSVVALADQRFYIDSSAGLLATYAGYTVRTSATPELGLSLKLSSFQGGTVSLSAGQQDNTALGDIAASSSATAFFLLSASAATTAPQTHTISLYRGDPSLNVLVCQRTFTYTGVFETIKALANKVTAVTSAPPSTDTVSVGDRATVTVTGTTGILGAGPTNDPGVLSYAPNALASFPSGSWRLERTELDISPDGVAPARTFTNRLFLSGASGPNRSYTARYTFRAVAPLATTAAVKPIQYIASGTQVKHTDVAGSTYGLLPPISSTANLLISKSASPSTLTHTGGNGEYTVTIRNLGAQAGSLDRIEDTIPAGSSYTASTSELNNRAIADPSNLAGKLLWTGPFSVAAGATATLTYTLALPAVAGAHTNSVVGFFGASQLDATRDITASTPATATVNVATSPVSMTALDDAASTAARQPVTIEVLANDTSGNGSPLSLTSVGAPSSGSATQNASNQITYTPANGFAGVATFSYIATDGNTSATATVTVTVSPIARNDVYVTPKASTLSATTVLANDDCTGCTVSLVTDVSSGTLTLSSDGTFSYTAPNSNGSTTFTYEITAAGGAGTATAIATIYVNGAGPDLATTAYDTDVEINVIANDTCAGGSNLAANTAPTNGAVTYAGSIATYNPNAGFWGTDSFVYKCSGNNTASVSVLVAPPATALQTSFDTTVSGNLTSTGFYADVTTIACSGCTYSITSAPAHGSATLNSATGAFSYDPNTTFAGADTLTYTVSDPTSGLTVTSTITVRVGPRAVNDSTTMLLRNTHTISPLTNDSCPTTCTVTITSPPASGTLSANGDGTFSYSSAPEHNVGLYTFSYSVESSVAPGVTDTATVSILIEGAQDDTALAQPGVPKAIFVDSNDPCAECSIALESQPQIGIAVLHADGSVTYTAPVTFSGQETFTYSRSKNGRSTTATVTVTVAPDAIDDSYGASASGTLAFDPRGNDVCASCVITAVGPTSNGGSVSIDASGGLVYDPTIGSGQETFTYTITDSLGSTDSATVTITIAAPPSAADDSATTPARTPVTIDVLANDTCTDCTVEISLDPAQGSAVVLADGSIRFTPAPGTSGTFSFKYVVIDPVSGLSSEATVTITVLPDAIDDSAITTRNTPIDINALQNDDCSQCEISLLSQPQDGLASEDDLTVSFAPSASFEGTVTFSYRLTDAANNTTDATITVVVSSAAPDAATTPSDTAVQLDVLQNDSCAGCSLVSVSQPSSGTASVQGSMVRFEPAQGFSGLVVFSYTTANASISSQAEVRILVAPWTRTTYLETDQTGSGSVAPTSCQGCTYSLTTPTTSGDVSIAADATFEYIPQAGYEGIDSFSYTITDPVSGLSVQGAHGLVIRRSTIQLQISVINDNAGTAVAADFLPTINAQPVTSGTPVTLLSGSSYAVGSTALPEYALTSFVCSDDVTATPVAEPVALQPGQYVTCIATYDDLAPGSSITITTTASLEDANANGRPDAQERALLTYDVTNTGGDTLSQLLVVDDLGSQITCPAATLSSGASLTCTAAYTLLQADIDAGSLSVTGTVTAQGAVQVSSNDPDTLALLQVRSISLSKSYTGYQDANTNARLDAGEDLSWDIVATNTGNTTTEITIEDGLTNFSRTCSNVAPGATCDGSTTHAATQAQLDAGTVSNTATATAANTDPAQASATATLQQEHAFTFEKFAAAIEDQDSNGDDAGDTITYTYAVANTGNTTQENILVQDDKLPTWSCTIASLAPGSYDDSCTATYTLSQADVDAGGVTNVAVAASSVTSREASYTASITRAPELSLLKSVTEVQDSNENSRTDAGDILTWDVTATNTGNVTLTGVTITDPLTASSTTCAELLPGDTCSLLAVLTLAQEHVDAGSVTNTATATAGSLAGDVTDTDSSTHPIQRVSTVALTDTFLSHQDTNGNNRPDAGETATFELVATNTGSTSLEDVVIDDATSQDRVICGDLAPQQSCTGSSLVTLTQQHLEEGEVTSLGSVAALGHAGEVTDSASATAALERIGTMTLTKVATAENDTNNNGRLDVAETVEYSLTVTNTGNVTLTGVTITDALTELSHPCADLAPSHTCQTTTTHTLSQQDIDAGSVLNAASAQGSSSAGPVSASDEVRVFTGGTPSLALSKVFDAHQDANGNNRHDAEETLTFTITATNTGDLTLTQVEITDVLAGVEHSCGTLAPGASCSTQATITLSQQDIDAGTVSNTATASSAQTLQTYQDSATVVLAHDDALSLQKTASDVLDLDENGPDAGDTVEYSFSLTNTGNTTQHDVLVTDALLPQLSCTQATLLPGATLECSGTLTLSQQDIDAGSVTNIATGSSSSAPSVQDSVSTPIERTPGLLIEKSYLGLTDLDENQRPDADDTLSWELVATNTGNVTLTGVTITDALTGLSHPCADLAPEDTCSVTTTYTLSQQDIDAGSVLNAASVESAGTDPLVDSDSSLVELEQVEDLAVQDVFSRFQDANGSNRVDAGDLAVFDLTATNTGNVTLFDVVIVDAESQDQVLCGDLAPGESCSGSSVLLITQAHLDAGSISSSATASSGELSRQDTATEPLNAIAELSLHKAHTETIDANLSGRLDAGDSLRFSLLTTNTGTLGLTQVVITDALANESHTCPALAPGESCSFDVTYTLSQQDLDAGTVTNTATATANGADAHAEATVTLAGQDPALLLEKSSSGYTDADDSADLSLGDTIHWLVTVTNTGARTATDVTITDGVTHSCNDLAPAQVCELRRDHVVTAAEAAAGHAQNTASAHSDNAPSQTVTASLVVAAHPALSVTAAHDTFDATRTTPTTRVDAGDTSTWRYEVTNTGDVPLTELELSGPLAPFECEIPAAFNPQDSFSCTATRVLSQQAIDAASVDAGIQARATSRTGAVSAAAPLQTPLDPRPQLALTKELQIGPNASCNAAASDLSVPEGSTVTWCFTLRNTGNVTLTDIALLDTQIGINSPSSQPSGVPASLAPGASVTVSVDRSHRTSLTNSATASASYAAQLVTASTSQAVLVTYPTYPVSGVVWLDIDRDGVLDPREPLLPDVAVELRERGVTAASARTATVRSASMSTRTDSQGRYAFAGVRQGNYDVVAISALKGFVPSSDPDGGTDWVVKASVTAALQLDFASQGAATLTGTASERTGGNIPNAEISCRWAGLDGIEGTQDDVELSTTANAQGEYEMAGVPFGPLSCSVTDPRTGRVEAFSASVTEPGEVRRDAEFSKDSPRLPRAGADQWSLLRAALASLFIGVFLLRARRRALR